MGNSTSAKAWRKRSTARGRVGEQPHAVDGETVGAILALRALHPSWGERKLKAWLEREAGEGQGWPCASSIGAVLKALPPDQSAQTPPPRTRRTHELVEREEQRQPGLGDRLQRAGS
ncbi:MAG: hypothetical protein H6509_08985 [Bryobacterales bacterium]|nr:hypothetical protein [Bryobacterales bacterium]